MLRSIWWNSLFVPPEDLQVRLFEGIACYNRGKYQKAYKKLKITFFNHQIQTYPELQLTAAYFFVRTCLKLHKQQEVPGFFYALITDKNRSHFLTKLIYYECIKHGVEILLPQMMKNDDQSVNTNPVLLHRVLSSALDYILQQDYKTALAVLDKYKETFSGIYFFNLIYIRVLYNINDFDEIVYYFEDNNYYLEGVDFLYILSAALYKLAYYDLSRTLLLQISGMEKKMSPIVCVNLGKIKLNKQRHILAINHFKKLSKKISPPEVPEGYLTFLIGVNYQKLGMLNEALTYYGQVTGNPGPYYYQAVFNTFLIYYDNNMFPEARELFDAHQDYFADFNHYDRWKEGLQAGRVKKIKGTITRTFTIPLLLTGATVAMVVAYLIFKIFIK